MGLEGCAPKKFLCRYPLITGSLIVGIVMSSVMVVCCIATAIQVINMSRCEACPQLTSRNAHAYSITAVVYAVIMLIVNVWFIWGVKRAKTSVVLGYLVISLMWLAQTFCLLIVLIVLYSNEANFIAWLLSLIFGLLAIFIVFYGLLVVYGHYLELKSAGSEEYAAAA